MRGCAQGQSGQNVCNDAVADALFFHHCEGLPEQSITYNLTFKIL
ncbi:hypothetical protein [Helicobacter sp. UBA3407]|nr:hypothetical protein [Helicobacter sp. UBA3407]